MRTLLEAWEKPLLPLIAVLLSVLVATAPAQTGNKPISKSGLSKALGIGGLTTREFVDIIEQRGVDFRLTAEVEADLRRLGAETALIEAVRNNYRGPRGASRDAPLSKDEILTLLTVGTSSSRVETLVRQRGISFSPTQATLEELRRAGAGSSLIAAIQGESGQATSAAGPPPPVSPAGPRRIPNLTQIRTVWVEPMEAGLDEHLRLEIGRQLAGQMAVVLDRNRADAILVGDAEIEEGGVGAALGLSDRSSAVVRMMDPGRRSIIWSAEAGDKSAFSTFRKGGPAKVAERLIKQLQKSLKDEDRR